MIREIKNKMDFDLLLTESDPNINLVRDYLEHGTLYGYYIRANENNQKKEIIIKEEKIEEKKKPVHTSI